MNHPSSCVCVSLLFYFKTRMNCMRTFVFRPHERKGIYRKKLTLSTMILFFFIMKVFIFSTPNISNPPQKNLFFPRNVISFTFNDDVCMWACEWSFLEKKIPSTRVYVNCECERHKKRTKALEETKIMYNFLLVKLPKGKIFRHT